MRASVCRPITFETVGLTRPSDIVGFWAKEDDCVCEAFSVVEGTVAAPAGPGLGGTLDMEAVERYGVTG